MNRDFFSQLETELGGITRDGAHLVEPRARERRRMMSLLRRGIIAATLAITLAASFDSEFPATANGHTATPLAAAAAAP